jgi:hypothetical protein
MLSPFDVPARSSRQTAQASTTPDVKTSVKSACYLWFVSGNCVPCKDFRQLGVCKTQTAPRVNNPALPGRDFNELINAISH